MEVTRSTKLVIRMPMEVAEHREVATMTAEGRLVVDMMVEGRLVVDMTVEHRLVVDMTVEHRLVVDMTVERHLLVDTMQVVPMADPVAEVTEDMMIGVMAELAVVRVADKTLMPWAETPMQAKGTKATPQMRDRCYGVGSSCPYGRSTGMIVYRLNRKPKNFIIIMMY